MLTAPPLIVIVTGANSGVGFGICQRLLFQLCQPNPPDALPQPFASDIKLNERGPAVYKGITLIMACRNRKRAEAARTKLLLWLEDQVSMLSSRPDDNGHARTFHAQCDVQIHELDLALISSVLSFAATMRQKMPYVSHLVCNAGLASFKGINWPLCISRLIRDPVDTLARPDYYYQHVGEVSADNLGWVWQSNVFSHFVLFRELQDLMAKTPFDCARVIWSSSLEASPKSYESEDWQLTKTENSYQLSKYQIDIIATNLDRIALSSSEGKRIRHLVSEPGVCSTSISRALVTGVLDYIKTLLFYFARLCGSPYHVIVPFKAAVATVHLILAPLCFIPLLLNNDRSKPVRFGAQTGRWGDERVGVTEVREWEKYEEEGIALIEKCDSLLKLKRGEASRL
ncbi:3-keto sterol reductase [Phlegmacium glaucopus]|nr:3-keto sterol reductase [Phlegmacium glaucopus]